MIFFAVQQYLSAFLTKLAASNYQIVVKLAFKYVFCTIA
jgi:hypothetical protein